MENTVPTIKEIAKRLKVSTSTVSRALHDHPSIGLVTTMRVKNIARELNYEPDQTAILFKRRKTHTIGVILPNLAEVFFSSALSGIEDYANKENYNVMIGQSLENPDKEKRILEMMRNHRVDGIIISITKDTSDYDYLRRLKTFNIPVVFFDRVPAMADVHYAACDLQMGMLQAIHKLVEYGHRRIGFINGPVQLLASKERLNAYHKGLAEHKIDMDQDMVVSSDLSHQNNHDAMRKLLCLKERPTAVITFNDYVALDSMNFVKKNNMIVNKDISFASFVNLPVWNYMDTPPLVSIEQFPYEQGFKAIEIFFKLLKDQAKPEFQSASFYKTIVQPQLIIHPT